MKTLFLSLTILFLGWNTSTNLAHDDASSLINKEHNGVHTLSKKLNQNELIFRKQSLEQQEVKKSQNISDDQSKQNKPNKEADNKKESEPKEEQGVFEGTKSTYQTKPSDTTIQEKPDEQNRNIDVASPSKAELIRIAHTFWEETLPPTENQKVKNFDSKQELIMYLNRYASENVASLYVEDLFEEKEDGLYIIPMCSPAWVTKNEPFTLVKINEERYQLNQTNTSDMHGHYTIQLTFTLENDNWVIESVNFKE
ncbi:hypothetical protein ACTWQL_03735 [Pseudalkalibacillus sp. R45]|uniref:hypothetical protein n=1 Tax=Pseudalkalibacillus sp. R45 TaxID=3457433 RepID=UPI003FCCC206